MALPDRVRERLMTVRAHLEGLTAGSTTQPRFLILTSGRSGSELLVTLLNSHPQIACDGEILITRRRWPERFIAGRAVRARRNGKLAYGLKVLPPHIYDVQVLDQPAQWVKRLSEQGWHIIRLSRANRLHQSFSMLRAAETRWHYRAGEAGAFAAAPVDPLLVMTTMYVIGWIENQITELLEGVEHLSFVYEDDLETHEAQTRTVDAICARIGIASAPTSTDLVRINPPRAREMVANYDEVVAELTRNRFLDYAGE